MSLTKEVTAELMSPFGTEETSQRARPMSAANTLPGFETVLPVQLA